MNTYFAIRQKSTGLFLPLSDTRRGGTWVEPTDKKPPRLYVRVADAKLALSHWLMGKATREYETVGESLDSLWGRQEDTGRIKYEKQEHRKADDMEIVEMSFSFRRIKNP